jgi:hypothetical protein
MRRVNTRLRLWAPVVVLACLVSARFAVAQNITEWSSEHRIILNFKVNDAALQRLLPDGWVVAPSASPGTPGANLNLTMMERVIVLDPQGKPLRTGTSRYMVLGVPAKNTATGQTNTMIVSGLSPEGAGAYDVYVTATTARVERAVAGQGVGYASVRESWEFAGAGGERVLLSATYMRGTVTKSHADAVVRSARHPDFQRTYHIDQAVDVLRSANTSNRVEQFQFRATGGVFTTLFDGSERLLGVSAVPFYVREISVP